MRLRPSRAAPPPRAGNTCVVGGQAPLPLLLPWRSCCCCCLWQCLPPACQLARNPGSCGSCSSSIRECRPPSRPGAHPGTFQPAAACRRALQAGAAGQDWQGGSAVRAGTSVPAPPPLLLCLHQAADGQTADTCAPLPQRLCLPACLPACSLACLSDSHTSLCPDLPCPTCHLCRRTETSMGGWWASAPLPAAGPLAAGSART